MNAANPEPATGEPATPAPATEPSAPVLSVRARLRAAAIAFVLVVECTAALPRDPFNRERLARAEGQRLIGWIERGLHGLGRAADREAIAEWLVAATEPAIRARNALVAPFGPFFHYTSTHQQWGLFITPKRESYRLHVDGQREDGAWVAIYRAPGTSVNVDGLAPSLRYRRVRGIYNARLSKGVNDGYRGFAGWVSERVLARHPEFRKVRVRMERIAIGEPGTPVRSVDFGHELTRKRRPGFGA